MRENFVPDVSGPSSAHRRARGGIILLLAALAAIGPLSTTIVLPSFPSMASELGVSTRDLGLTLSAFFISFAVGQLLAGPLSDRLGRRPVVLGGLAIYALGTIACAVVTSLDGLLAARIVQALGVCAASVLSRAIARDLFTGEALAKTLSLTMIAMAAAPGFSPLLGSALESHLGWRATFMVLLASGVALVPLYLLALGETHPSDRRAAHTSAALARAYGSLVIDFRFLLPAAAASLVVGALNAFFATTPSILIGVIGLTSLQLGLFFATTVIVVFAAGMAAPKLVHRFGAPAVLKAGLAASLLGALLMLAGAAEPSLPMFAFAVAVFLLGMGLVNPVGTAAALQPFGKQAGLASALLGFMQMALSSVDAFLATRLPLEPMAALGWILGVSSAVALFALVAIRPSPFRAAPSDS